MAGPGAYPNMYTNGDYVQVPSDLSEPSETVTVGLKSMQSTEEKRLFDIVDQIRTFDIHHELSLPQLVVCGSQSAGKSSVLEALSGYSFPRAEKTCTRFVTEIQFRRAPTESVRISILDKTRSSEEIERVTYSASQINPKQLPVFIKDAERKMGLADNKAFSRNILRLQITGPDHQPLTLVDLPGMIEVHSRDKDNIPLIKGIVDEWISEKRSIILAVVEAKNDAETQGILARAREVDPTGERTFGIITKPDLAIKGSQNERFWIEHAQNLPYSKVEFPFKKGWHVLLNRDFREVNSQTSTEDRDTKERQFFENPKENWHVIDPAYWGIETLRKRLRQLLFEHTKRQLPQVRMDITTKLDKYNAQLEALEERLQQPERMWMKFQDGCKDMVKLVSSGVDGKYTRAFFANYKEENSPRHLRSRIEEEYDAFQQELILSKDGINLPNEDGALPAENDVLIEEVKQMIRNTRGKALPGHVDPQRLDLLFWNHSQRWHSVATTHIERTYRHCLNFIECIVNVRLPEKVPGLPQAVCTKILSDLRKALKKHKSDAKDELDKLEKDREGPATTRNSDYLTKSHQKRHENLHRLVSRVIYTQGNQNADPNTPRQLATPSSIAQMSGEGNMDSDPEIMATNMLIYHTIARNAYVDNVIIQVIERHLLTDLDHLFYGDFGINKAAFFEMLQDDDYHAREAEKKSYEQKIQSLQACLDAL